MADEPEYFSPRDMREWADHELGNVKKEGELRSREINELVRAYSAGEITPEKADELQSRYQHRWGEALCGLYPGPNTTDEEILKAIDGSQRPFKTPRQVRENYRRRFGISPDEDVPGR